MLSAALIPLTVGAAVTSGTAHVSVFPGRGFGRAEAEEAHGRPGRQRVRCQSYDPAGTPHKSIIDIALTTAFRFLPAHPRRYPRYLPGRSLAHRLRLCRRRLLPPA